MPRTKTGSATSNARSIAAKRRHARARRLKGASATQRQNKRTTTGKQRIKRRTMKGARATQRENLAGMNTPTAGQKFQAWRDLNTSFRHYCAT